MIMLHYSTQKGLSAVLILILAVASIIGGAFLAKKMGWIKEIQELVEPEERLNLITGKKTEKVKIEDNISRSRPLSAPSVSQQSGVRRIENYYVNEPPAQKYYDEATTYVDPPTYIRAAKRKPNRTKPLSNQPIWVKHQFTPNSVKKKNRQIEARRRIKITKEANRRFQGFGYDVQLISTMNEAAANDIKTKIRMDGYAGFIEPVWRGRTRMFRVKVGHYRYRHEAEEIKNSIRRRYKQYSGAIVVSTDK